jgi:hypothetical protein
VIEMTKYRISVRKKDYEISYEEEDLNAFKGGVQNFFDLVEEIGKPISKLTTISKRGGFRPPFVKRAIEELIKKEPEWFVEKFPEDVLDKIKTQYGAVGAKVDSVKVVLIRLFKKGILTRKEIQGKYAYSVPTVSSEYQKA